MQHGSYSGAIRFGHAVVRRHVTSGVRRLAPLLALMFQPNTLWLHGIPEFCLQDQQTADLLSPGGETYVQVACIQLYLLLQLCEQLVVEGLELQDREKGRVQRGRMTCGASLVWSQFNVTILCCHID